ncbi:hypothetical protein GGH14_003323 [Coemansia sp. RSA 370]|nr:hypothetical protein GGH14_003323 [Coemansia sp. RSA 370]
MIISGNPEAPISSGALFETNLDLIQQNNLTHIVKKIEFLCDDGVGNFLLCKLIRVLYEDEEYGAVMAGIEDLDNSDSESEDDYVMPETRDAIRDVASKLTHILPNVDKLHIEGSYPGPALLMLYYELCHKLNHQLFYINTDTHNASLPYSTAPKLKRMCVTLEDNDKDIHKCIIPPSLTKLNLYFGDDFEWVAFVAYNWAAFTNITYLKIEFDKRQGSPITKPKLPVYKKPKVLFPCLTRLAIRHAPFTKYNCRALMQSPIQILEYTGPVSIANHLCTYAPSSIKVLRVEIEEAHKHRSTNDDTFRLESNITCAYLDLRAQKTNIDMAQTYWPQFTHVRLGISRNHNIGATVQALPNAVFLHLVFALDDKSEYGKLKQALKKMKQECDGPWASKVQKLIIEFPSRKPQSSLIRSLSVLKQYLPLVDEIEVCTIKRTDLDIAKQIIMV